VELIVAELIIIDIVGTVLLMAAEIAGFFRRQQALIVPAQSSMVVNMAETARPGASEHVYDAAA
jgi:hypothetical protein